MKRNYFVKFKKIILKMPRRQKILLFIAVFSLIFGFIFKLFVTWNGNFIFTQDNGRDLVDVREIVMLHKLRLIGPTSGIEGIFDGPFWYYLLAIPFVISNGNPYSEVVLMILLWVVGGALLLKLGSRWSITSTLFLAILWIGSNYVGIATIYSFNPNPVILLTPLLVFLIDKYIEKNKLIFSVSIGIIAGLFFNFEMAYGIFIPVILFLTILILRRSYILSKNFWLGVGSFLLFLLPQIIFYTKNIALLKNAINSYQQSSSHPGFLSLPSMIEKFNTLKDLYTQIFSATLMNWQPLMWLFILGYFYLLLEIIRQKEKKLIPLFIVSTLLIVIPFIGGVFLPITIMPWHLGGGMAAVIILLGMIVYKLGSLSKIANIVVGLFVLISLLFTLNNIDLYKHLTHPEVITDPSNFSNELAAVDYVYRYANGENFKVYSYIPSIIDYPYQYIFWWEGLHHFGYLPIDYAYLPGQPQYIKEKDKLDTGTHPKFSDLIFLIQEPDPTHLDRVEAWKNNFGNLKLIKSTKIGPDIVEVRKESSDNEHQD